MNLVSVIGALDTQKGLKETVGLLTQKGITGFKAVNLTDNWREELGREVPFFKRDLEYTGRGVLVGMAMGLLLAGLQWTNLLVPYWLAPWSAAGPWGLCLLWAGTGAATGMFIGGLAGFSRPAFGGAPGKYLLVVGCRRSECKEVREIIEGNKGVVL
ncbi:MAG: hypothetical protein ACM3WV_05800 [Bacillota bacterium]